MADQTVAQSSALTESSGARQDTNLFENEGVRVRSAENCLLCGRQGQPLYTGLRDRLFEAPGVWSLFRCGNCSLVWLNPTPLPEDIGKLYKTYYTHNLDSSPGPRQPFRRNLKGAILVTKFGYTHVLPSRPWRWLARFAALVPLVRDWAASSVMFLKREHGLSLLDVGCGYGAFLAKMRNLGWEVEGVEPGPEAARIAREQHGLKVRVGTLEQSNLAPESYDAITMSHVIEHLHDPVATLKRCHEALKPGGSLIVVTPNVASLGHRYFWRCYFHLDPPRHLFLFLASQRWESWQEPRGFEVEVLRTISVGSRDTYIGSRRIKSNSGMLAASPNSCEHGKLGFLVCRRSDSNCTVRCRGRAAYAGGQARHK